MKKERFIIAGGNTTLLVDGCPISKRVEIAQSAIESEEAEQVEFLITQSGLRKLVMMGDELCVNGTLALASKIGGSGKLLASGIAGEVEFSQPEFGLSEITFDLPFEYKKEENIVLFSGIGYLVKDDVSAIGSKLWELCKRYKKPAFGLARMVNGVLNPIVYVDKIGSCVLETACGSGSMAINIVEGFNEVKQIRGKSIFVLRDGYRFTVSAEVAKIGDKR